MYVNIAEMGDIPLRYESGRTVYLKDVATPKDANYIQTNIVRVEGKKEVYIPVYRQLGASTLGVVSALSGKLKEFEGRLTRPGISLKLIMDQSVYVKNSIMALVQEGVLGAILCSLMILMFLGEIRMTAIAIMTLPISIMASSAALYFCGQTINVMTLAGMTLAIGPMIDSAIICLENTHRHLSLGATTHEAAFLGASEVAMPELVSTLCTFLVLSPLVMTPGLGQFLFKPMAMAVAFSMIAAYLLSRTLVPACSAFWLKGHGDGHGAGHGGHGEGHGGHGHGDAHEGHDAPPPDEPQTFTINGNGHGDPRGGLFGPIKRAFARWEQMIESGIGYYVRGLDVVLRHRVLTVIIGFSLLAVTLVAMWPILRKEFFPEVDAGAFEMYVRAHSGTRIEIMEARIKEVEAFVRETIKKEGGSGASPRVDGPGRGPLPPGRRSRRGVGPPAHPLRDRRDARLVGRLHPECRPHGCRRQDPAPRRAAPVGPGVRPHAARRRSSPTREFRDLEFAFDAGGMVRSAMNEGKSTPISIRVTGKNSKVAQKIAQAIKLRGPADRRGGRRARHPARRLSPVPAHHRPHEGRRPGADPVRHHAERRGRVQLEHLVQQAQLLDRPGQQEPVLRRRPVLGEGHRVHRIP